MPNSGPSAEKAVQLPVKSVFSRIFWWHRPIPASLVALFVAIILLLLFNHSFWKEIYSLNIKFHSLSFMTLASLFAGLLLIMNAVLVLFAWPYLFKTVLVLIFLIAAVASRFMDTFGTIIDREIIRSVFETNLQESKDLLTLSLLWHMVLQGFIPCWLILRQPVRFGVGWRHAAKNMGIALVSLALAGVIVLGHYKDFSIFYRIHNHLRFMIVPANVFISIESYLRRDVFVTHKELQQVGLDAIPGPKATANPKPLLLVLVVGETARSANFSLQGYPRSNNPRMKEAGGFYFSNFTSCGTSTGVSVRCIFSHETRKHFSNQDPRYFEGLLDVLRHAGLRVVWLDNNTGCKEVCVRSEFQDLSHDQTPGLCNADGCLDEVLVRRLKEIMTTQTGPMVVVLHQKGSHGPAYYMRYPKHFRRYTPTCDRKDVENCEQQTIVNTYDNSILYTDNILGEVMDHLSSQQNRFDSAMLYFSDHGESLGENGLYLHGLPFFLAPEVQTQIPMYAWFSSSFVQSMKIDANCVRKLQTKPFSHDNLYDTVLGLLDIHTNVYRSDLDMFLSCYEHSTLQEKIKILEETPHMR
ncbi:MAG: sulfatase [Magnetococcales bacterium]|nr:sulfatase [Magnetococcales bacterium]